MSYIETILDIGISQVIIVVLALLFFIEGLLKTIDWLLTRLGVKTKSQLEKEDMHNSIKNHEKELNEIKTSLQELTKTITGNTEHEAMREGVVALLRQALYDAYNKWTEKGYCPIYAMEVSKKIYEQYHALGGNDVGTELFERLKELPTQPSSKGKIVEDNKYIKEF